MVIFIFLVLVFLHFWSYGNFFGLLVFYLLGPWIWSTHSTRFYLRLFAGEGDGTACEVVNQLWARLFLENTNNFINLPAANF